MVRAFGLLALLCGLFVWVGCGDAGPQGAPVATRSADQPQLVLEELSYDLELTPTPPTAVPAAPAPAMDVDAAPVEVEALELSEQTAPQNDLMAKIGEFSGTGLAGRGETARGAMMRQAGGSQLPADEFRTRELPAHGQGPGLGGDKFSHLPENDFQTVRASPLSTFSIDVDTASYSKTRSFLLEHRTLPPPDAVRIEELVNYFDYDYAGPTDEHPFAVHLETAECPWQPKHRLVRCALQGKKLGDNRPVSNLVFLIDVSGSMNQHNKLPLVQRSLTQLVRQLGENDRVSIVVYAGAAGLVLSPTQGNEQTKIITAIENLRAGGSTNGGQGIQLSYQLAEENFIKGGTNRVILCSDGDFNVGVTSPGDLVRMAKEKADLGIYLSVLGFGIGNHNDSMLEELSNKANGNYAFIDTDAEARKVFVEQMEGTLVTIAKDVKIQVEFNPAQVAAYRLIGYENRKLANRDFNDDKKDAGDIGAGHRVTALYELIPVGVDSEFTQPAVDPLKYQGTEPAPAKKEELTDAARSGELLTLKLRYQPPAGGASTLMTFPVKDSEHSFAAATPEFQFASAVASFGLLLRDSKYKGNTSYAAVLETATAAKGGDKNGLRNEFLQMVNVAQALTKGKEPAAGLNPPATGAWIRPQPAVAVSNPQPMLCCGTPDPPAWSFISYFHMEPPMLIFVVGVSSGVVLALIVVLFALGVVSLRSTLLVNRLPPAKCRS